MPQGKRKTSLKLRPVIDKIYKTNMAHLVNKNATGPNKRDSSS